MLSARKEVRGLPSYHPPLSGREGLRLDFNENTLGCSQKVLARLRRMGAEELARYPERAPVEAVVARHLRLDPEEVLLTNGVDEAIHVLCETYLDRGDEALIVVPTFSMYEIFAAAPGARIIKVPADATFAFPTKAILNCITPATRLIAIANPNNPTGSAATIDDLLWIARSAPHAAILVDEAYFEFHGETLLPRWREFPNLFVARTFSKAYGLAGLRIGILTGDPTQINCVRKVTSPYNVNSVALACLPEALNDEDYVRGYVREVCEGRARLEQELAQRGLPFWPSRANFVLLRLGAANEAFIAGMRKRGILVRDRSRDFGCEGCVRITLGTLEQTDRLLAVLRETLHEVGVVRQEVQL